MSKVAQLDLTAAYLAVPLGSVSAGEQTLAAFPGRAALLDRLVAESLLVLDFGQLQCWSLRA